MNTNNRNLQKSGAPPRNGSKQSRKQRKQQQRRDQNVGFGISRGKQSKNPLNFANQIVTAQKKGVGYVMGMTPSTREFAASYLDPFLKLRPRLPLFPIRASLTQFRQAGFTLVTNNNGKGWACFNVPQFLCNGMNYALYSNGPDASDDISGTTTDQGVATAGGAYTFTDFAPGKLAQRCVSYGFRVKYTGTELDKGGIIYAFQKNPRTNTIGMNSTSITSQYTEWKEHPVDKEWFQYNRTYTSSDDSWYNNFNTTLDPPVWIYTSDLNNANEENNYYLCLYIDCPTDGATFRVEVAAHYEVVGQVNNTDGTAVTKVDVLGHQAVVNHVTAKRSMDNVTPDHGSPSAGGPSVGSIIGRLFKDSLGGIIESAF